MLGFNHPTTKSKLGEKEPKLGNHQKAMQYTGTVPSRCANKSGSNSRQSATGQINGYKYKPISASKHAWKFWALPVLMPCFSMVFMEVHTFGFGIKPALGCAEIWNPLGIIKISQENSGNKDGVHQLIPPLISSENCPHLLALATGEALGLFLVNVGCGKCGFDQHNNIHIHINVVYIYSWPLNAVELSLAQMMRNDVKPGNRRFTDMTDLCFVWTRRFLGGQSCCPMPQ